ncbi:uncharacterized protein LOC129320767 isoform X2 [Prosopis cineraria]|uniref:uncharacterized protein LOC129320767 isoform X2 n=1 Tax=Prosopis cineraria TaxID=364024 RepID=UPI00241032B7|nr:uncharacterized protein LOC129320767 isoform X2 [Prosopis cineraria]
MQSLSSKALMDLRLPGRRGADFFGTETRVKRNWVNCRNLKGTNGIVACTAERNENGRGESRSTSQSASPSSFLSRSHTYALLKQQMERAAKSEDYKEAARIRDSIKSFEEEEPVLRLRRLMKKAIADERFTGIRVQVRSVYIEGRSQPSKGLYFFAYRIRITNNSDRPVQLLRRHWIITDANGKTENVWGMGVVGEQPVMLPRTSFEYSSACPISTPNGRMEGDFEMIHVDRIGSSSFNVAVAPFSLSLLGDDDGHYI